MPINKRYKELKNEFNDGGSKSMIDFSDNYVPIGKYDDTFPDFLRYLYEVERRISLKELNEFNQRQLL